MVLVRYDRYTSPRSGHSYPKNEGLRRVGATIPPRPDRFYREACLPGGLGGLSSRLSRDARKPVRSFEACLSGGLCGLRRELNGGARKPVRSFEAGRMWDCGDMPGILLQDPVIPFRSLKDFGNMERPSQTQHCPYFNKIAALQRGLCSTPPKAPERG